MSYHDKLLEAFETYKAENEKFQEKGHKSNLLFRQMQDRQVSRQNSCFDNKCKHRKIHHGFNCGNQKRQ